MDSLPDELLLEIFSYLDVKTLHKRVADVSPRWRRLAEAPFLNDHISLDCEEDIAFLRDLPTKRHIVSIEINLEVDLICSLLEFLGSVCPDIAYLAVDDNNRLYERHIVSLSRSFPHLKHLNVSHAYNHYPPAFLEAIRPLESVVLNNFINDGVLSFMAENCLNLKELHMYGEAKLYPLPQLHKLLSAGRHRLTKLTLRCCELGDKTCALIADCRHLTELRMYHCWLITGDGLAKLSTVPALNILHITGLKLTSAPALENFISACDMTRLLDLNLSSTTFFHSAGELLLQKMVKLKRLELWQCGYLTHQAILDLSLGLPRLLALEVDSELPRDVVARIYKESSVTLLRCAFDKVPECEDLYKDKLKMYNSFAISSGLCFRGNAEGWSANLMRYYHRINYLGIFKKEIVHFFSNRYKMKPFFLLDEYS